MDGCSLIALMVECSRLPRILKRQSASRVRESCCLRPSFNVSSGPFKLAGPHRLRTRSWKYSVPRFGPFRDLWIPGETKRLPAIGARDGRSQSALPVPTAASVAGSSSAEGCLPAHSGGARCRTPARNVRVRVQRSAWAPTNRSCSLKDGCVR